MSRLLPYFKVKYKIVNVPQHSIIMPEVLFFVEKTLLKKITTNNDMYYISPKLGNLPFDYLLSN